MKKIDVGLIGLGIFFMAFAARIFFEDWSVLLIIPMAILNGFINSTAIKRNKFGDKWHDLQYYILLLILGVMLFFGVVVWKEVIIIMAFYLTTFEVSVNLFSGWDWDWVGTTGKFDKLIRKYFKTLAKQRWFFVVSKIFALFIGYTIYMWNVPPFDFMP